jgi:phosphoketolase
MKTYTPSPEARHKMDACSRAASSLPVGQSCLCDNSLLKQQITANPVDDRRSLDQRGRHLPEIHNFTWGVRR